MSHNRFVEIFAVIVCFHLCSVAYSFSGSKDLVKIIENNERIHNIPRGILKSIATVESGIKPYVINTKKKSYVFKNQQEALNFIKKQISKNNQNFSLGCMQIHYKSHKHSFGSLNEMLSPEKNLSFAARFLKRLHRKYGNWELAIKHYHAKKNKLSEKYYQKVMRIYNSLHYNSLQKS